MKKLSLSLLAFFVTLAASQAYELFPTNSTWKYVKGTAEASSPDVNAWKTMGFNDSTWTSSQAPFYYDSDTSANGYTGNTVLSDMNGGYTCIFMRRTFVVTNIAEIVQLKLEAISDDGFLASINGNDFYRFNIPAGQLYFTNTASGALGEPVPYQTFISNSPGSILVVGTNVITVMAFNSALSGSSDFTIDLHLTAVTPDSTPPTLTSFSPAAGTVSSFSQLSVNFSEPVVGVDASDLLVNGVPATGVFGGPTSYTFVFNQPAYGPVQITWASGHGIVDAGFPTPNNFDGTAAGSTAQYNLVDQTAPTVLAYSPFPGSTVTNLDRLDVTFSEAVTGVDASDLLINGSPATNVVALPGNKFTFRFPPTPEGTVTITWSASSGIKDLATVPNNFAGDNLSYIVDRSAATTGVRINEFMASNTTSLKDEDGSNQDWIELYNFTGSPVNLAGWSLSDDAANPSKWTFAPALMAPNSYLIVFASGKDRVPTAPPKTNFHTNFKISNTGGYLALYNTAGQLQSAFTYPLQRANYSYGPDPSGNLRYFQVASPRAANGTSGISNIVGDVHFSVKRGFYNAPFALTITCDDTNATIRYTTNGSAPSNTVGTVYSAPLLITNTSTIRASAFVPGALAADVVTHTYIFTADVAVQKDETPPGPGWPAERKGTGSGQVYDYGMDPNVVNLPSVKATIQDDLKAIPTYSIVLDLNDMFSPATGIYANPSGDTIAWERPASIELMYPEGDGGFQINGGVRVRGGFSRSGDNPKHGLRLFFRQEYGEGKLNYDAFPNPTYGPKAPQSFNKYDLRTFQNYSWSFQNDNRMVCIRDVFSRDAQLKLGQASSHGDFYHLYINGAYWGIYNTDERPEANFGAAYFGGDENDYDTIKVAPDDGYIIYATDGNMAAWSNLWYQAVQGLTTDAAYEKVQGNNPDGTPNPAYDNLIDVDNLIDYMLVIYYGGNLDAPISNFLSNNSPNNWFGFRDHTGKHGGFRFVPHDSEHTLLNVNEDRTGPYTAGAPSNGGLLKSSPQYVYQQMWGNTELRMRSADHIQKACFNGGPLSPSGATELLVARSNQLYQAINAESARWGDAKREPPFQRSDWQAAYSTVLNTFVPGRTAVFIAQMRAKGLYPTNNAPIYSQFGGLVPGGYSLSISNPNPNGVIYYTLDGTDPRQRGGAVSPTASSYSSPIVLNSTTTVKARVLTAGNTWSAVVEAKFFVSQDFTKLIVSEIMYNPPKFGTNNGDLYEFLELKNVGTTALDLGGLNFTDGITFTFTNGTSLAPGQFFVLARATNIFSKYPSLTVNGFYGGALNNNGEKLTISHPLGTPLLSFTFVDSAPWPVTPDGLGFSLVPVNPNANPDPDSAASWRASASAGGSPGADDPTPEIPVVYINEVLSHSVTTVDKVELFNPNNVGVDVGGWFLTDDNGQPMKYRIPDHTMLAPSGYLVVDENQFGTNALGTNGFGFSSSGEQVYLFSGDGNTNLTGFSHGFTFDAADPDVSFGRYVNSQGAEQFPAQINTTFGSANAGPRVGPVVINEVNYHPGFGFDEFVELRNITSSAIPLFDPLYPGNTWKIGGLGYVFPQGTVIPANGFLIVAGISPAAFRTKYSVPANVEVQGPFTGLLQDGGETLTLQKPETPPGTNGLHYITVDAVRYNDRAPWPVAADGAGPSIQRLNSAAYGNDPINWFSSGITPGRTNVFNSAPVVSISSPANNSTNVIPNSLILQAAASDVDGSIINVEYFQNGAKIGESGVPPYSVAVSNLSEGSYSFTARATDNGFSVTESAPITIFVRFPGSGNGIGLVGEYFSNNGTSTANFNLPPTVVVTNDVINFDWGTGSPYPQISADNFSARWTGTIQPRYTDTYVFYPSSDDGERLYINNVRILDSWVDQGTTEHPSIPVYMIAGQNYSIKMEFYENGGGAAAQLRWSAPFLPKEVVPASQLYPTALPVIVNQFTDPFYATAGSNFVLSSQLLGASPFNVDWFFNGAPLTSFSGIPTNGSTSITVTNVQAANAGQYYFVVSNAFGYVTSLVANLTVGAPLTLASPLPASQTVVEGSDVGFAVGVSGSAPFTYIWTRGTFPGGNFVTNVSSFPNDSIVLPAVSFTNNGATYRVTVSSPYGASVTSVGTLNVLFPPKMVTSPTNLFLGVGSNLTMTATATGNPAPTYFWYFNQTNLVLAGTNRFSISNAVPANAGSYSVVASNLYGRTTGLVANVTMGVGPVITAQPASVYTVLLGQTANISMSVTGSFPMGAQLRRSGVTVASSVVNDSALVVTLPNVQLNQANTSYSIRVTNDYNRNGVITPNFALTVVYPPTFTKQPANATAAFGGTASFTATVIANPGSTFQWYYNQTNLIVGATNVTQGTNTTLSITNAQAADSGLYSVVASNIYGMATSAVATLSLPLPPQIVVQPQSLVVAAGSNVVLRVLATGNATLRYQWQFNGTNIGAALTSPSLLVANVQPTVNEGTYRVVITNTLGTVISDTVTLVVDSDFDGVPDSQEILAGTDPNNPSSLFKITTDGVANDGSAIFHFTATSNKTYSLLSRGTVDTGSWTSLTNISAAAQDRTIIITNKPPGPGQRFYRLVTPQLP